MNGLTLHSPAKINLFFRVLNKRSDGFHEVASLMAPIDLFDTLTFNIDSKTSLHCLHSPTDDSNLIMKAIKLFKNKSGKNFHVRVNIEKKIPIGGGLGGGSSNCATTLFALNQLFGHPFSKVQLMDMGSTLGSDVPFFFGKGPAFAYGRGEKIRECRPFQIDDLWLAFPPLSSSTPSVYQSCKIDALSNENPHKMVENILAGRYNFTNDLEPAAMQLYPDLETYKFQLNQGEFEHLFLTGSGSTFVGQGPKIKTIVEKMGCHKAQLIQRNETNWW